MFITFEGGEGVGKSTQAKLLSEKLMRQGYNVLLTMEPGGSKIGEEIRKFIKSSTANSIDAYTETLLFLAARAEHLKNKIIPALNSGKIVICDRFHDSTVVYQGICKGVSIDWINSLYFTIPFAIQPDLTFLIDCDVRVSLSRVRNRNKTNGIVDDHFDKMPICFHEKVRNGFITIAKNQHDRFFICNGELQELHDIIYKEVIRHCR